MRHIKHMIVKWGVCPYCKKATEFDSNKCRCPGCDKIINFSEIIDDE